MSSLSPGNAATAADIPRQEAELHTIKVGGRSIVLPAPDNGCQRCDHLGKHPLVPFTFRQRLLAFFIAGDATPTQARYFYVQCVRFGAGINETRETYAKLQAAIVRRDQTKGSIFEVTEDSLCLWVFYAPINMIFTSCMMLVAGRVLHLYGMCHRELSTTEREQIVMKSWRDRIIKANPDDRSSGDDVIGDSPMSECEEIATTINRLVKAGYIPKAQELLESSLNAYFVLQLAMFADKQVNANITIAAWKQAGLRLPAEDTNEFFPYRDSPSVTEEKSTDAYDAFQTGKQIWNDIIRTGGSPEFRGTKKQEALRYFDQAIASGYDTSEVFSLRGSCLNDLGFYFDALEDYNKAIQKQPSQGIAANYHMRSIIKDSLFDFEGSVADLKEAIRLSKLDNDDNRFWNYHAKSIGFDSQTVFYEFGLPREEMILFKKRTYTDEKIADELKKNKKTLNSHILFKLRRRRQLFSR